MEELQPFFADPDNWPDESAKDWPPEWRMFYLSTKWGFTDFASLMQEIVEKGRDELFHDVLFQLGYTVIENESGKKEIHPTRRDGGHAILRIARFVLEVENKDKSSQQMSAELRDLGYHDQSNIEQQKYWMPIKFGKSVNLTAASSRGPWPPVQPLRPEQLDVFSLRPRTA